MELTDQQRAHVEANPAAGMVTVATDGRAKAVRVGVGFVDGRLWSSATRDRQRTRRLRDDPRCTLYVPDKAFSFLTLECDVTILDGPDVPAQSLRFFRQLQHRESGPLSWFGQELDEDQFLQTMVDEGRVIYELAPVKVYGLMA